MKAVFIHDHNFVYDFNTKLYYDGSGGVFTENLWKRYLSVFDSLTVVGRKIEKSPNKLVVSSTEDVSFELIEGAHGLKNVILNKNSIGKILFSVIENVDFAIIRLPSTLGTWAVSICNQIGRKYVLEIVGDPFEALWFRGNLLAKLIAPIELLRLKKTVKSAQNVIYVTQKRLQKVYPCKHRTIGISNVQLHSVLEEDVVKKFYLDQRNVFSIGLIGSFHIQYKGHKEALKALRYLKERNCGNIELKLVGTGDSNWIIKLAKKYGVEEYVHIIGTVEAGERGIFPFLDSLDLYIHPSKTEGLARVIIEAMSRGKICLASNAGGTSELLDKNCIHEPGDWMTLAMQMENILKSNEKCRIKIAISNLKKSEEYLESTLQDRRKIFIKECLNNETIKTST